MTGCSAIGTTITTGPPKSTAPTEKYQPFILDEEIPVNAAAVDSLASAMTFPSTTDTSGAGTSTTSNPSSSPTCNRMSNVGPDPNFANSLAAIFCDTSKTDLAKMQVKSWQQKISVLLKVFIQGCHFDLNIRSPTGTAL